MKNIYVVSNAKARKIEIKGLLAIGGTQSSGLKIDELRSRGDYVILSQTPEGVSAHTLVGKKRGTQTLENNQPLVVDDLSIFVTESEQSTNNDQSMIQTEVAHLLQLFHNPQDLTPGLAEILRIMREHLGLEKGLVITRGEGNEFRIQLSEGVNNNDPWLTETLIKQTIEDKKPIAIRNIIGSAFSSNKSLIATGFLSAYTWPLILRGEVQGVLMAGSVRPHDGLTSSQHQQMETFVQLCSLFLNFSLRDKKLKEQVAALRASADQRECPILTQSPKLQEACDIAKKIAPTDLSVLILGATGVGKELMANWIHQKSPRASRPFVPVNCGAIPNELLESTLFGHIKGAFTGAIRDQMGKFEAANGGTLFLDEIGDLPKNLQVKLLRVLQEQVIEPVGSTRSISVNVRILAATHKNIEESVSNGDFREDLYYRLAEMQILIPKLSERREDIALLSSHFLSHFDSQKTFSTESWQWLKSQEWKGNVRELRSVIKRAAILSHSDEIQVEHLQIGQPRSKQGTDWLGGQNLEQAKSEFIRSKVETALTLANGNRQKAAKLLGISPRTLFRHLDDMRQTDSSVTPECQL